MNDAFGLIQKYTGISRYSDSEVMTPQNIVKDMVDMLPQDVFEPNSKFLDPAVKSGNFLVELYNRLMASDAMKHVFPNEHDRHEHILHNQLYGIAMSETAAIIVRKQLYDDFTIVGNIIYTDDKLTQELVQGVFNNMKFDVVIGNPPYNNDKYLDFVALGCKLAYNSVCMITPAKWASKGGDKNSKFRKYIVPLMSKVVFFPDTGDVFNVRLQGGVSYFLIDKEEHKSAAVKTVCSRVKHFESGVESINIGERKCLLYNNKIAAIVKKVGCFEQNFKTLKYYAEQYKEYFVLSALNASDASGSRSFHMFSSDGTILMTTPSCVGKLADCGYNAAMFSSDNIAECESFDSYINTKFVRFMILMRYCRNSVDNNESWSFVPDPGAFDHIFTDDELYKTYGLTHEEINIIESVIKERK